MVLAIAASFTLSIATNGWPAVSAAPTLNGSLNRLLNDDCVHGGQKSGRAVNLTSHQTIFDINGDTLLMPASTIKLSTNAAVLLRLSPNYRFRTAFLSSGSLATGVLQGDLYLQRYGDPARVLEEARAPSSALASTRALSMT